MLTQSLNKGSCLRDVFGGLGLFATGRRDYQFVNRVALGTRDCNRHTTIGEQYGPLRFVDQVV